MSYYDAEQRGNNITLLYLLLNNLQPERNISLDEIATDYDKILDEIMSMINYHLTLTTNIRFAASCSLFFFNQYSNKVGIALASNAVKPSDSIRFKTLFTNAFFFSELCAVF